MIQEQDYIQGLGNGDGAEFLHAGSMDQFLDHGHGNHEEIGTEDDPEYGGGDDEHGAAREEEDHDTDLCLGLGLPGGSSSRNGSNSSISSAGTTSFGSANGVKRGYDEAIVAGGRFHTAADSCPPPCGQQHQQQQQQHQQHAAVAVSDHGKGFAAERFGAKIHGANNHDPVPPAIDRAIGWPPIRSYRKNTLARPPDAFVKVNMDGVVIGRKVDLGAHASYEGLRFTLEDMFLPASLGGASQTDAKHLRLPSGSDYILTYEDKEGDWMLVGDVPWSMFVTSVRRLRIQRRAETMRIGTTCSHR